MSSKGRGATKAIRIDTQRLSLVMVKEGMRRDGFDDNEGVADVPTFQSQKKPKGKELTPEQKEHNRLISSIRIVIEHIISGIKRCRIVKDLFRNTKEKYDDLVIEIACGLHNFRVHCRQS